MNKIFCPECRENVTFKIKEQPAMHQFKEKNYTFVEKVAFCDNCGAELCIDKLDEENLKNLYSKYREANGIISIDKVREISYRYKIGKRPLSVLLGWGENTYSRYFDGDMPSKQYSDILLKLYNDPDYYIHLLKEKKDILNNTVAYKKSLNAAMDYKNNALTKIDTVAEYLLCKCEDITHLALQKMLYYVQAFYQVFFNSYIFDNDCEAWIHGPVYSEIIKKYSGYDVTQHNDILATFEFTPEEKAIMDNVALNFGCYSGKILEQFTHSELPWIETRKGLSDTEIENRIITKKLIAEYFKNVKEKYNMLQPGDIADYSKDMFSKITHQ